MRRGILLTLTVLSLSSLLFACGGNSSSDGLKKSDSVEHRFPDTLRVATLYSPEAYFIYKGQEMGYDYELVTALAADKNLALKMKIAPCCHEPSRCLIQE